MTARDTVVLGAAVGYDEAQITPFVVSLRRAGYAGDIALVAEPALARLLAGKESFSGIHWIPQRQWWPVRLGLFWGRKRIWLTLAWRPLQAALWLGLRVIGVLPFAATVRRRWQMRCASVLLAPTESRYLHFLEFLEKKPYRRVLLSDVRDVVFQRDPFVALPADGLAVSIEDLRFTVRGEAYNAGWVRAAYGDRVLEQIGAQPVACSGVTFGDGHSVCAYLRAMRTEIQALSLGAVGQSGVDQGIHNVLVWTSRLGPVMEMRTLAGPVATLGGVTERPWSLSADGRLLNRDGSVVAVVHQYDRHPALRATLLRALLGP
ncbi:MAG TPA: hypothetical protein VM240_07960 [Verrucomicrobiae bacterium]|nr:hypothetical protein [Verrucomicrobiae bacterium]